MRRLRGISLFGLAIAAAVAGLSAHATSAAPLSTNATSTFDATYSCPVQATKVVDVYAGVKVPAYHSPGALSFDTGIERKTVNGTTTTKTQAGVSPEKNGVKIDTKHCTKVKKAIALSTKKLPAVVTVTKVRLGYTSEICDSARRIVFRLQVQLTGGTPTSAVLAVRNADKKRKPIALVSWNPKKVTAHYSNGCSGS